MSHVFLQLWNFLRRPAVWLVTLFAGVAAVYFKPLMQDIASPVFKSITQHVCEFRKPNVAVDDSRFTVLISPLTNDENGWHTTRVVDALRADRAFRPIIICESLSFDDPVDPEAGEDRAVARGGELIKQQRADLLIFGKVVSANNSLELLAINGHGGCEQRPKPAVLKNGFLSDDFLKQTSDDLIAITVEQVAAACRAPRDMDWAAFAKQIEKLGIFVERAGSILPPDRVWDISQKYSIAMSKLYQHGQDEIWFRRATDLNARLLAQSEAENNNIRRFQAWRLQGHLLAARATRTGNNDDRAAAISAFGKAIEVSDRTDPPDLLYEIFNNRGLLYFDSGDPDRALADINEAIRLNPEDAVMLQNRGNAFSAREDYDRAVADYTEAIRLDPKYTNAYRDRGDAHRNKGYYDKAIADYTEAIRLGPEDSDTYLFRGFAHHQKEQNDLAIADYNESIRLRPNEPVAHRSRADAYMIKGDYDRAIADYDEALRLDPNMAAAYDSRGLAYFEKRDYDRAVASYDAAIGLDPELASSFLGRAFIHLKRGEFDPAIRDCDTAIQIDPEEALALYGRALAKKRKGDLGGSDADIAAATALQADVAATFARVYGE